MGGAPCTLRPPGSSSSTSYVGVDLRFYRGRANVSSRKKSNSCVFRSTLLACASELTFSSVMSHEMDV